jgi:hypothetical protein
VILRKGIRVRIGPLLSLPLLLGLVFQIGLGWSRSAAQPSSSEAEALYQLLATSPLRQDELPRGFARPRVAPKAGEDLADGAIGRVDVTIATPDLANVAISSHRIVYLVYASPADAEQAILYAQDRTERQGGQAATVAGFDYPATLLKTKGSARGSPAVGSVCLVQAGPVVIVGISVLEQHAESQADLNATDLAQAGVNHFDRLIVEAAASDSPAAATR